MRILVVEDDADVREALAEALEGEGHEVLVVAHGEEALSLLESGAAPDVIVLDLMMPVMSGPELCARLKRDPEHAQIPVVVLSAASEPTLAQARAEAALSKPVHLAELVQTLERVVRAAGEGRRSGGRGLSFGG